MKVQDFHGKSVIDSREVAEMVEKQHKNLLRDIASYIEIMQKSNELKIEPVDLARRKIMCKRYSTKSRNGAVKTEQNGGCIPWSPLVPGGGAVCALLAA